MLFPVLGLVAKLVSPGWPHNVLLGIAATFCVIVGFQSLLIGLIAEVLIRMNFETPGQDGLAGGPPQPRPSGRGDRPLPPSVAEFYDHLPAEDEAPEAAPAVALEEALASLEQSQAAVRRALQHQREADGARALTPRPVRTAARGDADGDGIAEESSGAGSARAAS